MENSLKEAALKFHEFPVPGKVSVTPTKSLATSKDLALAYSPGVAAPCMEIHADPQNAYKYTAKGNLVAVISNGTAVLGLGNIGALAGKPVMEGKGVLFKKFAGVDVFDIEIDEKDPQKLVDIIAALEPTFGGINLEDIKAPECFYIERELRKRCKIPVFREDKDRMDESKQFYAIEDNGQRVLADAVRGKDIFLGLSGANLLTPEMLNTMNAKPIVFAMANPNPEILPPLAKETRPDVVIGTGRSDFPNQVNNVLCFPFIFRGALDVGATTINEEMKRACVYALADLAKEEVTEEVVAAYGKKFEFGAEYLIPTPFDSRLLPRVASAAAKAAMESGVATRPIADLEAYAAKLSEWKL